VALTVEEASETYISEMRNVPPPGTGICATCKTFVDGEHYSTCLACSRQPSLLDAVVPITYSAHLGQIHTALRTYKEPGSADVKRFASIRLTAILWRFLAAHEACIAAAAGIERFSMVTTVPSSSKERDERGSLRQIVEWCAPIEQRFQRVIAPTDEVGPGRGYDERRYAATAALDGKSVLLVDDTWTGGGHAQSAAYTLREAGAVKVGFVAIGRHVRPDWQVSGASCEQLLAALPNRFRWDTCAAHVQEQSSGVLR
jgi:predicted amidophosphoribosyltransferase